MLERIDAVGGTLRGHRTGPDPARDPGRGLPRAAAHRLRRGRRRRRQPVSRRSTAAPIEVLRIDPRARAAADGDASPRVRAARDQRPLAGGDRRGGERPPRRQQPRAADHRRRGGAARRSARSPTRCGGSSASTRRLMSETAAGRRTSHHRVRRRRSVRAGGDRRQLPAAQGRDALPRRRVGQRQVADRAVDHAAGAAARPDQQRRDRLQGPRPAPADGARDAARARRRDRADLPGADDRAQSGLHHRQPDRRDTARARPRDAPDRAREGHRAARRGAACRNRRGACATIRISSRAACGSAR